VKQMHCLSGLVVLINFSLLGASLCLRENNARGCKTLHHFVKLERSMPGMDFTDRYFTDNNFYYGGETECCWYVRNDGRDNILLVCLSFYLIR
jgi:hypothetical protein